MHLISPSLSFSPITAISESVELCRINYIDKGLRDKFVYKTKLMSNLHTQETRDSMLLWLLAGVVIVAVGYLVYCMLLH